jgi:CheY-like chemotaxis protein
MSKILLVDDDSAVLGFTKALLESGGHLVCAAGSAAEAIAIAQEHRCGFNLLLTDMVMPVTGGHDLILAIRRMCPNMSMMAMSGALLDDNYREMDYHILPKPFTREQLLAAVYQTVNGRAAAGRA